MPAFTTQSARWRIFNAVATALEAAPSLQGVAVKRNPAQPVQLAADQYLIVVRWDGDSHQAKLGNDERRSMSLQVASLATTSTADQHADALHHAVTAVLRATLPQLNAITGLREISVREQDIVPDRDRAVVNGALVQSNFEITYRQPANT